MEISQKLKQLEENIAILQEIKDEMSLEDISRSRRYEWELRYGLFESIQIVIDIACKVSSYYNLGNPENYRECIQLLGKFNYIQALHVKTFTAMIGLRNLLIHEYATIETEKLYQFLEHIDDFKIFIVEIESSISV